MVAVFAAVAFVVQGQELSVFETKFTVKTSEIKDVGAKLHLFDKQGNCVAKLSAKVVYRVPTTKSYTLVMAYDGSTSERFSDEWWYDPPPTIGHTEAAHGRMWSSGDKRRAFVLTKKSVDYAYSTGRNENARLGTKGQHRYEDFEYRTDNGNWADSQLIIRCSGLANFDANDSQTGSTGTFIGWGMTPVPHSKLPYAEQGMYRFPNGLDWVRNVNADIESEYDVTGLINGTYNPAHDTWGDPFAKPAEPWCWKDTHFHGTYTTRRLATIVADKKKQKPHEVEGGFPKLRDYVDERVPAVQRYTDGWELAIPWDLDKNVATSKSWVVLNPAGTCSISSYAGPWTEYPWWSSADSWKISKAGTTWTIAATKKVTTVVAEVATTTTVSATWTLSTSAGTISDSGGNLLYTWDGSSWVPES